MRPFSHVTQAGKEFGFSPVQAHTLFYQTLLWLTTEGVTQMNHELLPIAIMLGFFPHCEPTSSPHSPNPRVTEGGSLSPRT